MAVPEKIPRVRNRNKRTHRLAPWGSAIADSKNGWLRRLLAWGATSDSKQEAGERLRPQARTQLNPIHCGYAPVHPMAAGWGPNGSCEVKLGSWPIYELGGWTGYTVSPRPEPWARPRARVSAYGRWWLQAGLQHICVGHGVQPAHDPDEIGTTPLHADQNLPGGQRNGGSLQGNKMDKPR